MRSRPRFSPSGWRPCSLARWRARRSTGARRLVGRALRLRGRLRRARLGRRRGLGLALVPRLLPLRRAADGAAPRGRLAAPVRLAPDRRARRSSTSASRSESRSRCRCTASSATSIPAAQDHLDFLPARLVAVVGEHRGHAGRRSCRTRHDQAPATRATRSSWRGSPLPPLGTALSGLGAAKTAVFVAIAALLLYGGFTASSPPTALTQPLPSRVLHG